MPRRREAKFMFTLPPDLRKRLEDRGARAGKGAGPFSYARQLGLTFGLCGAALIRSDPRETRGYSEARYASLIAAIPDPLTLGRLEIARLGDYLAPFPAFRALATSLQMTVDQLAKEVNGLTFAEKSHLVDAAALHGHPEREGKAAAAGASPPAAPRSRAASSVRSPVTSDDTSGRRRGKR